MISVGRIVGTFGIQGELKCDPSNAGRTLFFPGAQFHCVAPAFEGEVHIGSLREHKGRLLVRLEGVADATAGERFTGAELFAPRADIEKHLAQNEYLDADLIGCALFASTGAALGTVTDVRHYPASDMLIVDGKMVPLVKAFIETIDIGAKRIVADLPAGLLDD